MIVAREQPVVFVIDDDASVRGGLEDLLRSVGLAVESFGSAQDFLALKRPDAPGCIVLDVRLPGASELEFQRVLANRASTFLSYSLAATATFQCRSEQSNRERLSS